MLQSTSRGVKTPGKKPHVLQRVFRLAPLLLFLVSIAHALRHRIYLRVCAFLRGLQPASTPSLKAPANDRSSAEIEETESPRRIQKWSPMLYTLGQELWRSPSGGKVYECVPNFATAMSVADGGCSTMETGTMTSAIFVIPEARVTSDLEALLDLRHPGILEYQRIFADNTSFYIIAEKPCGPDLLDWYIDNGCYCGEVKARGLITQVLKALAYLQERRLLHRDVKMQSLFIDPASPDMFSNLKLGDLTGYLHMPLGQLSCQKDPVGTLMYAAPEALEGAYFITTDSFSAGVTLFMLLVSAPPFASDSKQVHVRDVHKRDWLISIDVAGASTVVRSLLVDLLNPDPLARASATTALTHRWISNECFAAASDRVNGSGEDCMNDGYALRFLKECGTGAGGGSSMSLCALDHQFETIVEGNEQASPRLAPSSNEYDGNDSICLSSIDLLPPVDLLRKRPAGPLDLPAVAPDAQGSIGLTRQLS